MLVHEMVHLQQHHFGKPGRGTYHNREWARLMRNVGLVPSDTGKRGGKETGDRVGHFIEKDGPFYRAYQAYIAANDVILYQDRTYDDRARDDRERSGEQGLRNDDARERARLRKAASKTRFTCGDCGQQTAWAKSSAHLKCGDCGAWMSAEPP